MGKLIYLMNASLDGYTATSSGGHDWTMVDDELHAWFNDETRPLAAYLYGRRMWEVMSGHWPTGEEDPESTETTREFARIWNATPKVVFSSSLDHVEHGARLVRGDVGPILEDVRREFSGDLGVGGPDLASQFVTRGLVDEYRVVVHPVVLGAGTPYWPEMDTPLSLRLVDRTTFASGVEARTYVPA
jgi:dihydrofolate reductase